MSDIERPNLPHGITIGAMSTSAFSFSVPDPDIYTNVQLQVIVVTEDKAIICLQNHLAKMDKKREWQTPLALAVAIVITLVTTDFKDFYLSAAVWEALFIFSLLASLYWLVKSLTYLRSSHTIQDVINDLKAQSEEQVSSQPLPGS